MLASGVSRGTERLVFTGRVPENQREAMRCPLQGGNFPFPVKYGYCAVGVVEEGPHALVGRRVFVLHPHQDRFPAPAAMRIPVPDAVPDHRAVLGANMETALNILWDAAPLPGERALVVGAGVVGLLVAFLLARIPGMRVMVCDLDTSRRAVAESFGAAFCTPEDAPAETGTDRPRLRLRRWPPAGVGAGGEGSADPGGLLVRRGGGAAAAGGGVPLPPPAADLDTGGADRRGDARAANAC